MIDLKLAEKPTKNIKVIGVLVIEVKKNHD